MKYLISRIEYTYIKDTQADMCVCVKELNVVFDEYIEYIRNEFQLANWSFRLWQW